jgi:phage tail-like protein
MSNQPASNTSASALAVSHVADFYRRYPGETVTLYTRVDVLKPVSGFTLRIGLPAGLTLGDSALTPKGGSATALGASRTRALYSTPSPNHGGDVPRLLTLDGELYLMWELKRDTAAGERYEYQLQATIAPVHEDTTLISRAVVTSPDAPAAGESVSIAVAAKGGYLKYLPALYTEQDEFMGRLLMLFESFWKPIDRQIDDIHYYVDPRLAPPDLLPWLASWVDLTLDEQWPEEKRRLLLLAMVMLYRRRGTRRGLQDYLEIYAGRKPQITEHGAHNFRLSKSNRLGPSVALGRQNMPHTFSVGLRLPRAENEQKRQERRRKIEAIIESEKPAHTSYTLNIEEE